MPLAEVYRIVEREALELLRSDVRGQGSERE
jgi:hypothetical protein